MCTTLIYILTRFKSTALSAIIITHLLKGSAQSLLHLRRAAAGSCPSAPSKHTSGTAWYPNSFSTHLKPLHSNGVMAAQWSGGASAAQRRLDIIFLGAAAWRRRRWLPENDVSVCLTVVVDHTPAQLDSYANAYTQRCRKAAVRSDTHHPGRCVYALWLCCECI